MAGARCENILAGFQIGGCQPPVQNWITGIMSGSVTVVSEATEVVAAVVVEVGWLSAMGLVQSQI